jgi:Fe-S-cluster containining protein
MARKNQIDLKAFARKAKKAEPDNIEFFSVLKKTRRKDLQEIVDKAHNAAFEKIDCLDCAGCCKTISPTFEPEDIRRLSKHLGVKPKVFIERYLEMDEDGDFVHHGAPCPFLKGDNKCSVYEARPEACRGYPHTGDKQFRSIIDITLQNTLYCPAVFEIVESLKKEF